jgi:hypothetical protein
MRRQCKFSMALLININISQRHQWKRRKRNRLWRTRLPRPVLLKYKKKKSLAKIILQSHLIPRLNLRKIKLMRVRINKMTKIKKVKNHHHPQIDNKLPIQKGTLRPRKTSARTKGTDGEL